MIFFDSSYFIVSISLIIESIAIVKLLNNIKSYKETKPLIIKKIVDLEKGMSAIQGRIVALEPELVSPYRKKKCVYYHFEVKQKMSMGLRGTITWWWNNLVDDEKNIAIGVDDGTGMVEIDLKKASVSVMKRFEFEISWFKFPNDYQRKVLSNYEFKKDAFGIPLEMRFKEYIIEEGTEVYLQGDVFPTNDTRSLFKNAANIIISKPGKNVLLKKYKKNIFLSVLSIIAGIAILFLLV